MADMTGQTCPRCGKGTLAERSLHDDWQGLLTCDQCLQRSHRWVPDLGKPSRTRVDPNLVGLITRLQEIAEDGGKVYASSITPVLDFSGRDLEERVEVKITIVMPESALPKAEHTIEVVWQPHDHWRWECTCGHRGARFAIRSHVVDLAKRHEIASGGKHRLNRQVVRKVQRG